MNLKNKIFFLTLGCPKNEIISEKIAFISVTNNFQIVDNIDAADYVIINSCGFIEDALRETIEETLKLKKYIVDNNLKTKIILTGCACIPFKNDLKNSLTEADYIFNYEDLLNFFNYKENILYSSRFSLIKQRHYNYLAISEGCSKNCTYCIIPLIKGKFQKLAEEQILKEAEILKTNNTKEIIIVSQDTLSYGKELLGLVKKISQMNFNWIRLMYFNPDSWEDYFINLYKIDNVLRYIEMPVQHLSDNILKRMGRKKSFNEIKEILFKIKEKYPDISIRTTVIVGFPGETEKDFELLAQNITELPFDLVGTFIYSDMINAPSYKLKDKIKQKEKIRRFNLLNDILSSFHSKNMKKYINKEFKMIIDDIEEINYTNKNIEKLTNKINSDNKFIIKGRIYSQAPEIDGITLIENPKNILDYYKKGNFINIKVQDSILENLIAYEK